MGAETRLIGILPIVGSSGSKRSKEQPRGQPGNPGQFASNPSRQAEAPSPHDVDLSGDGGRESTVDPWVVLPRVEAECKKRLKELAAVANRDTASSVESFLEHCEGTDPESEYQAECSRADMDTSLWDMLAEAGYNPWIAELDDLELEHPNASVVSAVWCGYDYETGHPQFDLKFYSVTPTSPDEGTWELTRRERGTAVVSPEGVWTLRRDDW